MNKLLFQLISILSLFLVVACNNPKGDAVDLKFNMKSGDKFDYTMNMDMGLEQNMMGQNMKMQNSMSFTYVFEVLGDSAGWKTMAGTIGNIKADIEAMGMSIHVDSDKPMMDSTGPAGMMNQVFNAMKGQRFSFTMNEKGQVGRVEGMKEMLDSMAKIVPGGGQPELSESFNEESFRQNIEQSFAVYPGKPVRPGESWTKQMVITNQGMKIKSDNTYTLESVKGNDAVIKIVSKLSTDTAKTERAEVNMTGSSNGVMHYDLPSGIVTDGNIDMDMDMKIKSGEMEIPMKMKMKMTMKGSRK